ncbi:metallothionein-like protein type 3 [Sorghum bicolor]|uniref:metallothionein-like protein type 3 n=1 Tax=Sorghum bicolor TaxID=4558 RepID=UPI00081AB631|nr:metallothionein-like protein type 3 [Sorghum bicolor]|eukprot:XP_021313180.1 metallothionein-like protein type 3 [Sorghum bicolor]
MSATCGNCDCADKTQCTKKGDSYGAVVVDTERYIVEEEVTVAEHDGACKCGASCYCGTSCSCGK